jgi:hypothetical protein
MAVDRHGIAAAISVVSPTPSVSNNDDNMLLFIPSMKRLYHAVLLVLGGLLPLLLSSCVIGPCGVAWVGESSSTNVDTLPPAKYDAAEAVYRKFLPGGGWPDSKTNFVYSLSYGVPKGGLSADFMARFPGPEPRVGNDLGGLIFQPGVILERKTKRDVVFLSLERLSIYGSRAKAKLHYATGSLNAEETLQLAKRDGRWRVTEVKETQRSYF